MPMPCLPQASGEEYLAAHADPVAQFSAPVCGHMNKVRLQAAPAVLRPAAWHALFLEFRICS